MKEMLLQAYRHSIECYCRYPALVSHAQNQPKQVHIHLLAIGKAAWQMASIYSGELNQTGIAYSGFVLTKYGHAPSAIPYLQIREAGHPFPDQNSIDHTREIISWLHTLEKTDHLIVLLSGGSSALFERLPPSIGLEEFVLQTKALMDRGTAIDKMNSWRKQLSLVKGGKALSAVPCESIDVLAISDVDENKPSLIGSGPFTPLKSELLFQSTSECMDNTCPAEYLYHTKTI
ncbi:MAG: DUF4147 domain-containing protein [Candidatus Cloacimonadaceae bacterium]|nr:DUF4147 domain-containing protein [Candidatus Cloacimonadaceae bacterium]